LQFAGKAINKDTGEWPNNRLVLVFLKGKEIGRAITARGDFPASGLGVTDGLFVVEVENAYGLTGNSLSKDSGSKFEIDSRGSSHNDRFLFHWFGDVEEGGGYHVDVPSKNLEYVVKIVEGDVDTLPPEMRVTNSLRLRSDGTILAEAPNGPTTDPTADGSAEAHGSSVGSKEDTKELRRITVPINNCGGNAAISQKYTQVQTFIHTYNIGWTGGIGGEIPLPLRLHLIAQLELEFGFEQGQIDTRSIEYTMAAQPHTHVRYIVTWSEVWKDGTTAIELGDAAIDVPFRARTDLIYAVDSEPLGCP
jgi:hypothetical protein